MAELNSHLLSLDKDKEIGAIVLTGGEKVFAGTPRRAHKFPVHLVESVLT